MDIFQKKNNCLQRAYFIMFMPSYIESLPSDVDQWWNCQLSSRTCFSKSHHQIMGHLHTP